MDVKVARLPRSKWPSWLLAVALLVLIAGERVVSSGTWRIVAASTATLLTAVALGWRAHRVRLAAGETRIVERWLLVQSAVGAVGLACYLVQSDFPWRKSWTLEEQLTVVLLVLSVVFMAISVLTTSLVELSYAAVSAAPTLEISRLRQARSAGLSLAFLLVTAFSVHYVASRHDVKVDLSYARAARMGTATQKLVASLDDAVEIFAFVAPAAQTRAALLSYLEDLARAGAKVRVEILDAALDTRQARELKVNSNGTVVFRCGSRSEFLAVNADFDKARTQLKSLDKEVYQRLLGVARAPKILYFTQGHGERSVTPTGPSDTRATVAMMQEVLTAYRYTVKMMSPAEGFAAELPQDAQVVVILGPREPFAQAELLALEKFQQRGGHLLIAVDPEAAEASQALLGLVGVTLQKATLAHAASVVPRTHTNADRTFLVTATNSSHPAVSTLSHQRGAIFLLGAGALLELPPGERQPHVATTAVVRSQPGTWIDRDGNFEQGKDEPADEYIVALTATTRTEGHESRAFVIADSDAFGDEVLAAYARNNHVVLLTDALRWLVNEEQLAGDVASEEDIPLALSRRQDFAMFYGTTFAVPAAVLGAGWWTRRRRKRGRR